MDHVQSRHGKTLFEIYSHKPDKVCIDGGGMGVFVPIADLHAFVEAQAWVRVEDGLPKEGDVVDVWKSGRGRITDVILYWRESDGTGQWNHQYGGYCGGATITHWRALPAPPETKS